MLPEETTGIVRAFLHALMSSCIDEESAVMCEGLTVTECENEELTVTAETKLAVIIPTTGATGMLKETLGALAIQTDTNFETVVVFDCKEEPLPAWYRDNFDDVLTIFTGSNLGFAGAVNCGIRQTESELVFLLNDDTKPAPDCIHHLLAGAEKYPAFHGFATRICLYYSPEVIESAGDSFSLAGRGFHRGWRCEFKEPYNIDMEVFGACGCGALYRRELLNQTGLFEEDFFAIHEDVDMAFRARRKGFKFMYLSDAVILHKGSMTIGPKSMEAVFLDSRNSELLLLKNMPLNGFLRILPWYVLYSYHSFLCALRRGYLGPYLRGKLAALGMLSKMWQKGSLIELEAKVPFSAVSVLFDKKWHREGIIRALTDYRSLAMICLVPLALISLLWLIFR